MNILQTLDRWANCILLGFHDWSPPWGVPPKHKGTQRRCRRCGKTQRVMFAPAGDDFGLWYWRDVTLKAGEDK